MRRTETHHHYKSSRNVVETLLAKVKVISLSVNQAIRDPDRWKKELYSRGYHFGGYLLEGRVAVHPVEVSVLKKKLKRGEIYVLIEV